MKKLLQLALSKYEPIPPTLQGASEKRAKTVIELDLAALYHHFYLDTYGVQPPSPDPAQFEHIRFLMPDDELRFQGDGVGASTSAKRSKSSEMGQAFCRWFLHEHLGIKYFAHLDRLIDDPTKNLARFTVERVSPGDMPDYLCSAGPGSVVLAEAKGRYTSVGFHTSEFNQWRAQFTRIKVLDANGVAVSVKGHIVATRFATELKPNVQTKLYAEDPSTEGKEPISGATAYSLSERVIASHYGDALMKIDQPHLAFAIWRSLRLERQSSIPVTIWQFAFEGLPQLFVGGYYAKNINEPLIDLEDKQVKIRSWDPFRLGVHSGTFVGIELSIFKHLVEVARGEADLLDDLPEVDPVRDIYSGMSMLGDGSIIGPLSMFIPIGTQRF
ncbi:hypothetical protein SB11R_14500 [Pseudomonas oryzihabitans]|nr:hypothetical protein SB11R_14500 [Pseudomonas psychrotolerans]